MAKNNWICLNKKNQNKNHSKLKQKLPTKKEEKIFSKCIKL